jgi:hypothetical protein
VGRQTTHHAKRAAPDSRFRSPPGSGMSRSIDYRKRTSAEMGNATHKSQGYNTDCPYAKHREHWEHAKGRGGFSNETDDGWINSIDMRVLSNGAPVVEAAGALSPLITLQAHLHQQTCRWYRMWARLASSGKVWSDEVFFGWCTSGADN